MFYISGLVIFLLLLLAAEARVGNSSESKFCTETEQCLLYDLVCANKGYEVRHYDSVKWVSTDEDSYFMGLAAWRAFYRLYKYITGANDEGVDIAMTSPVIFKVERWNSYFQPRTYTMSFLLPAEYQKNAPKPTNDKVNVHDMQDMKVYVKSYGGWMKSSIDTLHAGSLSQQLDAAGARYDQDYHFAVGYDSPMKIFNRHNEVWYVVNGEPVC